MTSDGSTNARRLLLFSLFALIAIDVGVVVVISMREPRPKGTVEINNFGDIICGPRCIKYLLDYYHPSNASDLMEIVREVQWPDLEAGASMTMLQKYLEGKNIHTLILRGKLDVVQWPHPVLVHLTNDKTKIGHYVIRMPRSQTDVEIFWVGLEGLRSGRIGQMPFWKVDYFMLTSIDPISKDIGQGVR